MSDIVNEAELTEPSDLKRRSLLQLAAGIAATASTAAASATTNLPATGKPGDFHFLSGNWKIRHRRLKGGEWDIFEGEASVVEILGGVASVEELRIPLRNFSGMGLRLLDVERKLWADYWVNGKNGILTPPPSWGSFSNGAGIWESEDKDGDQTILVRGVWDQITGNTCRWYQTISRDQGKSWQENWIMHWQRA
ncbi:hypothetical protein [Undibacterium sp. TS12]|uniref:hypothetical protein n=1 Tax=Undibacterium sp. TS12 TaxID=2908202 RepID=UPI001F4D233B|nr:hypothetical protein [Undibacterium sp. TS12]MCH8620752.1 hypothetical protein [Undibacterium sp. TS12]